jgi:hypothetical protein
MMRINGMVIGRGNTMTLTQSSVATVVRAEPGVELRVKVNDRVVHIIDFGPAQSIATATESKREGHSEASAAPRTYVNAPAGGSNVTLELAPGSAEGTAGRVLNVETDALNISVLGSVHGSVTNVSGDVAVGETVRGNVNTMSGNVSAAVIHGNAQTMSGDIDHRVSRRAPAEAAALVPAKPKTKRSVHKAVPEPPARDDKKRARRVTSVVVGSQVVARGGVGITNFF